MAPAIALPLRRVVATLLHHTRFAADLIKVSALNNIAHICVNVFIIARCAKDAYVCESSVQFSVIVIVSVNAVWLKMFNDVRIAC
jgi:hypothetical protein